MRRTRLAGCHHSTISGLRKPLLLVTLALNLLAPVAHTAGEDDGVRDATQHRLDIKPLPLADALQELARQTGVQVVFFSSIAEGHRSPALSGAYTISAAMRRLLAGSGLVFREINARTIEVRRLARNVTPASSRASATAVLSAPASATPSKELLQEIEVNGTAEQLVATRVPTPLREIPQSISVISAEQLRQQNQFDLTDILTRAPGVAGRRWNSLEGDFFARAFPMSAFRVDGGSALKPYITPVSSGVLAVTHVGNPDLSEFDRVELLRGSDTLFAGNGYPGGTVSLVRKRPLSTPHLNVTATLGSWNNQRIEFDVTGPLDRDGTWRGRADAVFAERDFFFDTAHLDRKKLFAAVEYDVTADSTLTAGFSYQTDDAVPLSVGWPLYSSGHDSRLPRDLGLTTDWSFYRTRFGRVYLQYAGRLGDNWRVRLDAEAARVRMEYEYVEFGGPINPDTRRLISTPLVQFSTRPTNYWQTTAGATLTGALNWFGLREEIAIGADYVRFEIDNGIGVALGARYPDDLRTFDQGAYLDPRTPSAISAVGSGMLEQYGAFGWLRAHLNDAWSITLGGRLSSDRSHEEGEIAAFSFKSESDLGNSGVFTPYAALMYRINDHYSWYVSYADIYLTSTDLRRADGQPLGPAHGATVETGVKGVWRDGLLNAFLALYRIRQSNVPAILPPPRDAPPACCVEGRTTRSQGAEFDINGQLRRGWVVGGGYAHNANQRGVRKDVDSTPPRHLLKLWTSLRMPDDLDRWTLGGSLRAQGKAQAGMNGYCSTTNSRQCKPSIVQKAFAVLDLRSAFQVDSNWEVALSLNNVLDRNYYDSVLASTLHAWYGEPRNVMLRIDGRF